MANVTIGPRVMVVGLAAVAALVIIAVVWLDADEVALRLIDAVSGTSTPEIEGVATE